MKKDMEKKNFLKTLETCEYPADFLAARLQGKRGNLFQNWEVLIVSGDPLKSLLDSPFYPYLKRYAAAGIWRHLQNEYQWVYKRMNTQLRNIFASYFAYHEINTLVICLRYLHSKTKTERILQLLQNSLMHQEIQKILTAKQDFPAMLETLEAWFCSRSNTFDGMREEYASKDFGAFEQYLRNRLLSYLLLQNKPPILKTFFQYIVDFHNSLTLAKHIRWQVKSKPVLISGGAVKLDRFSRAYFRKDLAPVLKAFHLNDQEEGLFSPAKLESDLLSFITKELKRQSFQKTIIGDILFYLWEQFRYARNISMILHTNLLDDESVRKGIVA